MESDSPAPSFVLLYTPVCSGGSIRAKVGMRVHGDGKWGGEIWGELVKTVHEVGTGGFQLS